MKYITNLLFLILFIFSSPLYSKVEIKEVSIQLNWKYQFEYAGFIIAKEKGFYKDIGFDVELKEYQNSTHTVSDMLNGDTTFAISDSLFMIERQKNDIVLLANYIKQSPLVIATNKDIKHPKDLESKLFMSSEDRIINTPIYFMFRHLGVEFSKINFKENTYDIQDLIDNKTDAMEVYRSNELYILEKKNISYNVLDPKDYGFNSGAINMFTMQNIIDKLGKDRIQSFIEATNKGWKYAFENRDETINIIFSKYNQSLKKTIEALSFEAKEIERLFLMEQYEIGDINKKEIYRWNDILNNYGLLESEDKYIDFLFNQEWREKVYTKDEINLFIYLSSFIIAVMLIILYFSKSKEKLLEQKNKEIESQQKVYETLFNDSSDGILIIKEKTLIDCNKAVLKMLEFESKKDFLAMNPTSLYPTFQPNNVLSKDQLREQLEIVSDKGFNNFEWIHLKSDGSEFWVDVTMTSMSINNQDVIHTVWRDISENKKLEQSLEEKKLQLFEQSKMAALGEMIGNIAHQWRQPLSVISTGATGIQLHKELEILEDDFLIETCDSINKNAQYLSKTIDDFKNFIKGERIKKVFLVREMIDNLLHLIDSSIKSSNIDVIVEVEENLKLNGYENELIQCLMNIFNNAKDASDERENKKGFVFINSFEMNDDVVIKIKDNAGGIPDDVISHIFEPYFTTKHKKQGTGLGLHMTYNLIVDGMIGNLTVKNVNYTYKKEEYRGAEFSIILPKS